MMLIIYLKEGEKMRKCGNHLLELGMNVTLAATIIGRTEGTKDPALKALQIIPACRPSASAARTSKRPAGGSPRILRAGLMTLANFPRWGEPDGSHPPCDKAN